MKTLLHATCQFKLYLCYCSFKEARPDGISDSTIKPAFPEYDSAFCFSLVFILLHDGIKLFLSINCIVPPYEKV